MEQCQTCRELWGGCASAAQEITRLSQEVERALASAAGDAAADLVRRLQSAIYDRAVLQSKLKIHLAVAHSDDIGKRAASLRTAKAAAVGT